MHCVAMRCELVDWRFTILVLSPGVKPSNIGFNPSIRIVGKAFVENSELVVSTSIVENMFSPLFVRLIFTSCGSMGFSIKMLSRCEQLIVTVTADRTISVGHSMMPNIVIRDLHHIDHQIDVAGGDLCSDEHFF